VKQIEERGSRRKAAGRFLAPLSFNNLAASRKTSSASKNYLRAYYCRYLGMAITNNRRINLPSNDMRCRICNREAVFALGAVWLGNSRPRKLRGEFMNQTKNQRGECATGICCIVAGASQSPSHAAGQLSFVRAGTDKPAPSRPAATIELCGSGKTLQGKAISRRTIAWQPMGWFSKAELEIQFPDPGLKIASTSGLKKPGLHPGLVGTSTTASPIGILHCGRAGSAESPRARGIQIQRYESVGPPASNPPPRSAPRNRRPSNAGAMKATRAPGLTLLIIDRDNWWILLRQSGPSYSPRGPQAGASPWVRPAAPAIHST